ncbi:TPA: serine-type D-Ala-D-Ala carboxypeptidase, partial [Legionella pneumophila]
KISNDLQAPIKKGDKVGDIIVQFNNNIVSSKPLYALQTVESGGFYTRTKDSIRLAFKRWFGS